MSASRLSLVLCLFVAACGGGDPPAPEAVPFDDVSLSFFRTFPAGVYVFKSQAELAAAWGTAPVEVYGIGLAPGANEQPAYDFSAVTVVGLSQGLGTWCYKPRITDVTRDGDDVVVRYLVPTVSTLACLRSGPMVAFATIPRLTGKASFVRTGP